MAPENPPRRAKGDQKPVTIDLEPNAQGKDIDETVKPVEDPVEIQPEAPLDLQGSDTLASDVPASDVPAPDTFIASDAAADEKRVEAEVAEEARADAAADAAAAAFAEKPVPPDTSFASTSYDASPPPQRASNAGPLAAGILGGLIALLAAGGLQYAGVLPALGPGSDQSGLEQRLSGEIDALKTQVAAQPASADLSPLESRLAALEKTTAEGGASTLEADVANLTTEVAALKSQLADARQSTEAAKTELSTRIDAAEKKIDEPASDVQLARAIAVTALKTAIDRGGPFLAELDALKSVSPDDPAVAGLTTEAATGVAARNDLTRDFPATADAMLGAIRHSDPNQGVFARLMDSASSVIRVRPVGSVEGEGPEAVVARIEDKLTNGDLKGASLEWDALPAEAKTAGADFRTKLDQRIRIEGLIDTAVSGAMTANQG